jgi:hypothetical protein
MTQNEKDQILAKLNRQLKYITNETRTPNFDQTIESISNSYNNNNLKKKRELEELLGTIDRILKDQQ